MAEYASDNGFPDAQTAAESLISSLGVVVTAADGCASEAVAINDTINDYIDNELMFDGTTPIDELVVDVLELAINATDYVNDTGRTDILEVYDNSTAGWP